ncbi:MAG: hypothetical protein WC325_12845, partial [Candidatus Bathyarchaeia archaeon]
MKIAKGVARGLLGYIGENWNPNLIGNPNPEVPPAEDLVLQKKIDELAQKVAELNTLTSTIKDKQDSLWTSVDNVKKDTEELY